MKVLVTGTAGFIGYHLAEKLLANGFDVVGVDCVTDYYDVALKQARLDRLKKQTSFTEYRENLADKDVIQDIFVTHKPDYVVNLAAQAGVRHSIKDPWAYTQSNIEGFLNILEGCRNNPVKHLVFASTSSVYGGNDTMPFSPHTSTEHPLTLYAATKKANELMAHNYAHLFNVPATGLRFFTVYGPWGRPDMALFLFTKNILEGKPIDVFNHGNMKRDFTYVDDIVEGIFRVLQKPAEIDPNWDATNPDPATSGIAPYRILNIGNSNIVELNRYIEVIEQKLGKKAIRNLLPMQDGDVPATLADMTDTEALTGFKPTTSIETGISNFIDWYLEYYQIKL